jgi:hypothetical protein
MMYCLRLEDKLDGATNFRGTHLYISYIMRVFAGDVHLAKGHLFDSRSKGILDLVHSEEAQELEATMVMSPTNI